MKITPVDGGLDRRVVTAMIVSDQYLREVREMYSPELLTANYARTVAGWCIDYYTKYGSAPKQQIEDQFKAAELHGKIKEDQVELIRTFLTSISKEYDQGGGDAGINVEFLLDETESWFQRRDLEHLRGEIDEALRTAGPEAAEDLLRQRTKIERSRCEGYNPLTDEKAQASVFESSTTPLFTFPGAMGQLMNNSMTRDQLIGIMGPEKSGKTFLLTEVVKRACIGKCNVALFELGDMSSPQINRRLYSNICGMPYLPRCVGDNIVPMPDCGHCQQADCPTGNGPKYQAIKIAGDRTLPLAPPDYVPCQMFGKCAQYVPTVTRCTVNYPNAMGPQDIKRACAKLSDRMGSRQLRFQVAANDTTSAEMMNDTLTNWKEKLSFVPDVIVVDYDMTMAKEKGCKDDRDAYNAQWKWFRRMSQEWHCLFIVASQTDSDGLDRENLKLSNFSGDKRKYSHVTGMLGVHAPRCELSLGLARISWMLSREESLGMRDQVLMGRHLGICRPIAWSMWRPSDYRPKELVAGTAEED
jgi:hypothetical protein